MEIVHSIFETKRLLVKPLRLEDAPAYQKYFNDYEVISHLSRKVPWPYPEDGALSYLKFVLPLQGIDRWDWGIFEKSNPDECIGSIGIFKKGIPEHRGFWLAQKHWGKGYMTEAVEPVTSYAFDELGFTELLLSNAKGNERSRRLKEKVGAEFLYLKSSELVNPDYKESEIWRLTKEAWKARS